MSLIFFLEKKLVLVRIKRLWWTSRGSLPYNIEKSTEVND